MIFFAVTSPTPGSASRSFWLAVFRSTGAEEAGFSFDTGSFDADFSVVVDFSAVAGFSDFAGFSAFSAFGAFSLLAGFPAFTIPEIFSIWAFDTPAFERSATEE